jgi:hypothetical protein
MLPLFTLLPMRTLLSLPGEQWGRPKSEHTKLLELFTLAQQLEDARALELYVAGMAGGAGGGDQSAELAAARIMAGMHSGDALQLHKLVVKVTEGVPETTRR